MTGGNLPIIRCVRFLSLREERGTLGRRSGRGSRDSTVGTPTAVTGYRPLNAVRTTISTRALSVSPGDLRRGLLAVVALIAAQALTVLLGVPDMSLIRL